jgi:dihydroorotate dehydrogenase (fumarate)
MADLNIQFMGLKLDNPIVIAASGMTGSVENIKKAVDSGAGAIVLKSLFEEQIVAQLGLDTEGIDLDSYPEAEAFVKGTGWEEGTENYLKMIADTKKFSSKTPIFASINCVGAGNWASFARRVEEAGADGIELNIAYMPFSTSMTSSEVEDKVLSTIKEVRMTTKLPLEVKLGQYFTSLPHLAKAISREGANALVLFNRFFRFDIDLEALHLKTAQALSSEDEYHESLRWISILYQRVGLELAATTGAHDAQTVAKLILAGASTVQLCSVIIEKGWKVVPTIIGELARLMDAHGMTSVESVRGKLSAHNAAKPEEYLRLQYIKALTGMY